MCEATDPLVAAARLYIARATGFAAMVNGRELGTALAAEGMRRYEARLECHWQTVARFEQQVEHWDERRAPSRVSRDQRDPTAEAGYRYWRGALRTAEAKALHLEAQHVTWEARVHRQAARVVDALAAFQAAAHASARAVIDELATLSEPRTTTIALDARIADALRVGATLFDTPTFAAFVQRPTFEAAAAWANELGRVFVPAVDGVPGNWSAVIAGIRALPATVTTALCAAPRARVTSRRRRRPSHRR